MDSTELITLLKKQETNLRNLISVAEKKQRALISNNYEALESSIVNEEQILSSVHTTEKVRVNTIRRIYVSSAVKSDSSRLADFVERFHEEIPQESSREILEHENRLKELVSKVSTLNKQNIYLIEHARDFLRETINTVVSDRKKLLDKKV